MLAKFSYYFLLSFCYSLLDNKKNFNIINCQPCGSYIIAWKDWRVFTALSVIPQKMLNWKMEIHGLVLSDIVN